MQEQIIIMFVNFVTEHAIPKILLHVRINLVHSHKGKFMERSNIRPLLMFVHEDLVYTRQMEVPLSLLTTLARAASRNSDST